MPSLSAKDRVPLCSFTFSDGRRCRSHRFGNHPRFCSDHAQKEARANAAESLSKDLAYFFSGDYLSACDLSTAMGRLIPAVIRGEVKPRAARTVAYMAQILLQSIQISRHEYINAFDTDNWRQSIRHSVNSNYNRRFPPAPQPTSSESPQPQPQPAAVAHPLRGEAVPFNGATSSVPTKTSAPLPPSPHTPLPATSAELAQHVLAGLTRSLRPGSTGKTGAGQTPRPAPDPSPTSSRAPQTSASQPTQHAAPTPSAPATQSTPPSAPTPQPPCPDQSQTVNPTPPRRPNEPNRDAPWWDSRHLYDPPDSHLL